MSISSVEGTTPSAGVGALNAAATQASEDKELFLQLLVAQLKYQDPSNPADSTEFLSQTAQFNALEKMGNVADQMGRLVGLSASFGAGAMVGENVSYVDANGEIVRGVVNAVRFEADGPVFVINGTDVPMANVLSLEADGYTPTSTDDGTDAESPTLPPENSASPRAQN